MSKSSQVEKLAGEQSKSKLVFKTGSPADIPVDGLFDFVCIDGIGKFQIDLVEVFSKVRQVLRPGGHCCILAASGLDSFIYYGMENGFDYIKSEIIETEMAVQYLLRKCSAGTSALFFNLSGPEWSAECKLQIIKDEEKKITSIWFLRN